jgi:hypothetical protein
MTAFVEVTCGNCGSFEVIPVDDVRERLLRESPFQCAECHRPVSVDVLHDFEPDDAAWFSNTHGIDEPV